MVVDVSPLCYPNVTLCVCLCLCVCGYLSTITNIADVVVMVVLCFIMVSNMRSNTYHLAQLACFVRVVRVLAGRQCCLSALRCQGKHKDYPRTNGQNGIFGHTQDHLSINNVTAKHGKRGNDNDDDDGGVVHSLHTAVMEQRVSTYGL